MNDFIRAIGQRDLGSIQPDTRRIESVGRAIDEMNQAKHQPMDDQDRARDATLRATEELAQQVRKLNELEEAAQESQRKHARLITVLTIIGIFVGTLTLASAILVPTLLS